VSVRRPVVAAALSLSIALAAGAWPMYRRGWEQSGRAGIARGAYHFFTFCRPGIEQAGNFLATTAGTGPELAPVADVEYGGNCKQPPPPEAIRAELRAFLDAVERETGWRPMLYATREAESRLLGAEFATTARWGRDVIRSPDDRGWKFWQFADNGRVAGVTGTVDLDVFQGTRPEFEALLR
jgi:lysozyme